MATDAQILAEAQQYRAEHLAKQYEAGQKVLRRGWGLTARRLERAHLELARVAAAAGLRPMQDSVTWQNCNAPIVGGYADGRYAWPDAAWRYHSSLGRRLVRYTVNAAHNVGNCLDVEWTDATPQQAPGWIRMRRQAGEDGASVYCNTSTWPQVRGEFHAQGVPEPDYDIAAYPGIGPNLYPGSVAHQYADPGPVDLQVVAPFWRAIDGGAPPQPPVPVSRPAAGGKMVAIDLNGVVHMVGVGTDGNLYHQWNVDLNKPDPPPGWENLGMPAPQYGVAIVPGTESIAINGGGTVVVFSGIGSFDGAWWFRYWSSAFGMRPWTKGAGHYAVPKQ